MLFPTLHRKILLQNNKLVNLTRLKKCVWLDSSMDFFESEKGVNA